MCPFIVTPKTLIRIVSASLLLSIFLIVIGSCNKIDDSIEGVYQSGGLSQIEGSFHYDIWSNVKLTLNEGSAFARFEGGQSQNLRYSRDGDNFTLSGSISDWIVPLGGVPYEGMAYKVTCTFMDGYVYRKGYTTPSGDYHGTIIEVNCKISYEPTFGLKELDPCVIELEFDKQK